MRLVYTTANVGGDREFSYFNIAEIDADSIPKYAILSHTWEDEEVTFQDMVGLNSPCRIKKKGYAKIRNCCAVAKRSNFDYVWIDSCCIDKTSSAELSEAINSMYRWYQEADVCYAYLADVSLIGGDEPAQITNSRWFTRGWTLQELLAPEVMIFYDRDWNEIGDKLSLQHEIAQRTAIPPDVLTGTTGLEDVSVARRMSWAAGRKTKRIEDRAYSLMGIFGVYMPLLYGEGEMAFIRLQEEIIKIQDDYTIFAWRSQFSSYGGLLAVTPDAFKDSADVIPRAASGSIKKNPWMVTNQGIHLELSFVGFGPQGLGLAILPCVKPGLEDALMAVILRDISLTLERFERVGYDRLVFVDPERLRPPQYSLQQICVQQRKLALTSRQRRMARSNIQDQDLAASMYRYKILERVHLGHNNTKITANEPRNLRLYKEPGRFTVPQLFRAAKSHDTADWIQIYLSNPHLNINLPDSDGTTLLALAAKEGLTDIAWILLSRGDTKMHPRDKNNLTPLIHAAINGHTTIMTLLLSKEHTRADLTDTNAQTILHYACRSGQTAAVQLLLERSGSSSDPNAKDGSGRTPLIWATKAGHRPIVSLLLLHGAEINAADTSGKTPISWAAMGGNKAMVSLLLSHGAEVNTADATSKSPLHWAVMNRQVSTVRLLLSHGAKIEKNDELQRTALHWAAFNGATELVELLIAHGASVFAQGSVRETPLHLAAIHGHEAAVQSLLKHGASIKASDTSQKAALHYAIQQGHVDVVRVLLAQGADVEFRDFERRKLVNYAKTMGHSGVVEMLRAHRSDNHKVGALRRLARD